MKRKIFIIAGVFLFLIVVGIVYAAVRISGFTAGGTPQGSSLPETNPFEGKSNPFKFYKNPFDSSYLDSSRFIAQVVSPDAITFSIKELGNCGSQEECRAYCNQIENIAACVNFAEKHNLMSAKDAAQARKFAKAGGIGPGGCTNKDECESYCVNLDNIEECVEFAEKYGVLPEQELAEARSIRNYIRNGGAMPGNCKSEVECKAYCKLPANIEVCLDFAEKMNLISPKELAEARKVVPFIGRGETPGKCVTKEECDIYCSELNNMEECLAFAEKAGLMPPEELRLAKRVVPLMIRGETPGGCLSQKQCVSYCQNPAHFRVCLDFAEKAGILNKIEITMLKQAVRLLPQE